MTKSALLLSLGLSLLALVAAPAQGEIPLPSDIKIVAPAPGLPANLAAFLGKWSGNWSGRLEAVVVVEEVTIDKATVIYAWDDGPLFQMSKGGGERRAAKVVTGEKPEIQFGIFTLQMGNSPDTISVTRVVPQGVSVETFKKVIP